MWKLPNYFSHLLAVIAVNAMCYAVFRYAFSTFTFMSTADTVVTSDFSMSGYYFTLAHRIEHLLTCVNVCNIFCAADFLLRCF